MFNLWIETALSVILYKKKSIILLNKQRVMNIFTHPVPCANRMNMKDPECTLYVLSALRRSLAVFKRTPNKNLDFCSKLAHMQCTTSSESSKKVKFPYISISGVWNSLCILSVPSTIYAEVTRPGIVKLLRDFKCQIHIPGRRNYRFVKTLCERLILISP